VSRLALDIQGRKNCSIDTAEEEYECWRKGKWMVVGW
jgi:hypothetical protein